MLKQTKLQRQYQQAEPFILDKRATEYLTRKADFYRTGELTENDLSKIGVNGRTSQILNEIFDKNMANSANNHDKALEKSLKTLQWLGKIANEQGIPKGGFTK